jgi:tRNA-2-methylthio-N6-dimethylallyladenosine synthase
MKANTKKRAYVETYGCQMNISDGELMQGVLEAGGYQIVHSPEEADVVLVNTCAIREHAETRVLGRVSQLNGIKRERPEMILGVTGCMAQRMGKGLLEKAPYVDLVMGPDGYRSLAERLDALGEGGGAAESRLHAESDAPSDMPPKKRVQLAILDLDGTENYEGLGARRASGIAAWVPIQRGCNHRCTFCIVPYVRGSEKNRHPEEILSEVRGIAESGITEVTLLGQTVNSFAFDDWDFPKLLRTVARVDGIRRVRFTSPHPNDVTPQLVEVMAAEPTVCKQLHLPVQSGNDRTLKRMLRRYTRESFMEKVDLVRAGIPGIALSTDVIVAFPGETEAEYQDTLDLMREVRFDDAFLYRYSLRDGTPATRFPENDFIPAELGQRRLQGLIDLHREIQSEITRAEVGRVEEVLVEREAKLPGQVLGRTEGNKVVAFPGPASMIGTYQRVELTRTTTATFVGELIGQPVGHPVGQGVS